MARRTFFSFHYERDVWRASVVRNSAQLKPDVVADFIDASLWEEAKRKGDDAIRALIASGLAGTSVTCVLIGSETASRRWVNYEIDKSRERGNGLFGLYIDNIKDQNGKTAPRGANPLAARYRTYDWEYDNGYTNLGGWIDRAYNER